MIVVSKEIQFDAGHRVPDHASKCQNPQGVGVIITGAHSCMSCRGVGKVADMVTSSLWGAMRDEPSARAELLALHAP